MGRRGGQEGRAVMLANGKFIKNEVHYQKNGTRLKARKVGKKDGGSPGE